MIMWGAKINAYADQIIKSKCSKIMAIMVKNVATNNKCMQ